MRDVIPPSPEWGPSLREQVERWEADGYCECVPMNDALFVIDSAAADLLEILLYPEGESPYPIIGEILAAIRSQVEALYECGVRNFLIADLLPLAFAPGVVLVGDPDIASRPA